MGPSDRPSEVASPFWVFQNWGYNTSNFLPGLNQPGFWSRIVLGIDFMNTFGRLAQYWSNSDNDAHFAGLYLAGEI